jgi:GNAT superfamily N-acetyltransferase
MSTTDTPSPVIRPAGPEDLDLVAERRLLFLSEYRGMSPEELDADFVAATRRFLERTHCQTFRSWLAEIEGSCVGIVSIIVSDAPPRPEDHRDTDGYVVNMHVDADHRSAGIGRLLIQQAVQDCEAAGVRRFSLFTTDDGRPLYESLGFADEPGWLNRYVPPGRD